MYTTAAPAHSATAPAFALPLAQRTPCGVRTTSTSRRPRRALVYACARPPASNRAPALRSILFAAAAAAGALATTATSSAPARAENGLFDRLLRPSAPTTQMEKPPSANGGRRESTSFVTKAVRTVGKAVVRIDTERVVRGPAGILLQPDDDALHFDDQALKKFFSEYYGKKNPGGGGIQMMPKKRLMRGQGSGFITSQDGIVITNAHVVKGAEKVTVTLTDGRTFSGTVKGTDELLDLAVVKIDNAGKPQPLPVATLGNSSDLQVGDWVIAVGNPVGLDNTVTVGIVSSLNRSSAEVGFPDKRMSLIQTSTPLNIGNSGGPLLNEFGEVVGINTAVRINAEAIGFAIPIDRAKLIAQDLANGKRIAHAYVGIQMMNVTPELAKDNNDDPNAMAQIPEVEGALVVRVMPTSPAASGGLRRFDIIVGIDGRKIKNVKEAQNIVDGFTVDQNVNFQVVRGYARNVIDVNIKTGDFAASAALRN